MHTRSCRHASGGVSDERADAGGGVERTGKRDEENNERGKQNVSQTNRGTQQRVARVTMSRHACLFAQGNASRKSKPGWTYLVDGQDAVGDEEGDE